MADQTGSIDLTYQNATARNLLAIANEVSNDAIGRDAGDNGRPTKADIYRELNRVHRRICQKHDDWTFIKDTKTIKGYSVSTDTTDVENTTDANNTYIDNGGVTAGNIDYYSETKTFTSRVIPNTITTKLSRTNSWGDVGCTLEMLICPEVDGSPDLNNILMSSNAIVVTNSTTDTGIDIPQISTTLEDVEVEFTFGNAENEEMETNTKYWITLKVTYQTVGTTGLLVPISEDEETTKYMLQGDTTWSLSTRRMYSKINYYSTTQLTELELGSNVETVQRIFSGDVNLFPYPNSYYVSRGGKQDTGTFVERRTNTSEELVVEIQSGYTTSDWSLDFTKKVVTLSDDADVPLVPSAGIDMMILKAYSKLVKKGLVTADPQDVRDADIDFEEQMQVLEMKYRPAFGQFELKRTGSTSTENHFNRPINQFEVK